MQDFFQHLSQRYSALIALLAGLLYPLGFAPYGWYLIVPLSMAILLLTWTGRTPRQAAANGFLFGFTAFLSGIYWITISVHTFGGAPLFLAVFLMLALVAFMAGYWALLGYLLTKWVPTHGWYRAWLAFPCLWILLEWLRGWLFTGFGWLSPGYAQIDGPLAGYLPVLGMLAAGWVVAVSTSGLAAGLLATDRRGVRYLLLPMALWLVGAGLALIDWTTPSGQSLRASLVQGSVPQDLKWLPDQLQPTIDLYADLTRPHLDSDLIVWPEAAIPRYKHALMPLWEQLESLARSSSTEFLVGTIDYDLETEQRFNSVSSFGSSRQVYQKRHLVPFGEFFPVPDFIKQQMRVMNLPYQNFSAGKDGQSPIRIAGQTVSVSICYEDVFGHEMRDTVADSTLMINVSNDAWFGGSLAPHQHLQIARVRAAEAGRALLRSTNNGITALIDRKGTVLQQIPQFEPAVLTANVEGSQGVTPYTRWGDWPIMLFCLFGAGLLFVRRRV